MKIQKLPPEARTKLESGVIVANTVQCVLELVRNSLDAYASGVAVRVDLKNFHIKVIDNGKGIGKDDLELVGERFMTSKHQWLNNFSTSRPTYGYRGQAISSILDLCGSMTIKTKSENKGPTLVKMFVKGKAGQITEIEDKSCGTGTTIIVEDFMCSMPIRRKRIKEVFEMDEIKTQLQYMALIHYNVCFTLRNENKHLILLQTSQASNMLEMISQLYGKETAKRLKPVKFEENHYNITGYASTKLSKHNNIQIVYLNRQVITKGVIHKFVNNVMKEYNGSKTLLSDSPAKQILKKLKNSHHMFIIEIKCPRDYYELFTNLRKTTVEFKNWKDVLKCIHRGLKKAYKLDCERLGDSVSHFEDGAEKCGISVLVNAVKGVPATRNFHKRKNLKKQNQEGSKKGTSDKGNEEEKLLLVDSMEKRNGECTSDTLETPIPKNLKAPRQSKSNFLKSHPDVSFIDFYNWIKESSKADANAFNLYNEFLHSKNEKNLISTESYKSPVLGVQLKGKRMSSRILLKTPEKKQKTIQKDLGILCEEIALMTQNSSKIFPNVDLRIKKGVRFNADVLCKFTESPNFDFKDWKKQNEEVFKKPLTPTRVRKHLEVFQSISSPASSETHFTNIIKFRNLSESFQPPKDDLKPVEEESYSNTWMSHYQDVRSNNFLQLFSASQNYPICRNEKNIIFRDVTIQTSCLEAPQKMNAMVQTSQMVPESSFNPESNDLVNEIPVPDFWNTSTPGSHALDLNNIISPKTDERKESASSEFIRSQTPKLHSNPKSDTETQTLRHLWTDSLSVFGNVAGKDVNSNTKSESIPKTIPLEQLGSPQFCFTERHDFVPKGLSPPEASNSKAVEIPMLDSPERNRIHLTIDDVKNDLLTVKWLDESTGKCAKPAMSDAVVSKMEFSARQKSVNFESHILSASLSFCAIKVHNLLHSFTFSKELLSTAEVLGQLDEKFIVTKMKVSSPKSMVLISLLDQHAVDERIKLEKLLNDHVASEKLISTVLRHSLELTFTESQLQVLIDLRESVANFGFDIKPKNQETILVNSVPTFLFDKYQRKNEKESFLKDILHTVFLGIVSEATETRGALPKIPKILHDEFSSEACHSAVKFNQALAIETMTKMISDLKNCKLPFQCAHGRPSVIPIIDLEDFKSLATSNEEGDGIDLQKIMNFYKKRNEYALESAEGSQ